jgi:hypothetical protein
VAPSWVRGAQLALLGLALFVAVSTIHLHNMADRAGLSDDLMSVAAGFGGTGLILAGAWWMGRDV